MSRLPIISPKELINLLEKLGFEEVRQKGSHRFFKHRDGRTAVVPVHGEDLGRGLIRKILSEIKLSIEEYEKLRK